MSRFLEDFAEYIKENDGMKMENESRVRMNSAFAFK